MKRLEDELKYYADSDFYPFHMPGHKRQGDENEDAISEIYRLDITEIDGFDDLHHPKGILRDLMNDMQDVYGTKKTYISVNGSTAGILASICAVTHEGDAVLVARNCHKSVMNACDLKRLDVSFIMPECIYGAGLCETHSDISVDNDVSRGVWTSGIYGGILPERVEEALAQKPEIKAVIITSPTYEGVVSDIQAIADIAHAHGAVLIADEAHGAHLPFAGIGSEPSAFPKSALKCGADLVIQSLHKTLPAMTQTALLHVNSRRVDTADVERYLSTFISSSPSYVLMASVSRCFHYMVESGFGEMRRYEKRVISLREELVRLKNIELFGENLVGKYGCLGYDIGKLVLISRGRGRKLADDLRNKYHLETEMSAPDYVICMTSLADTEEGFDRLLTALREIDKEIETTDKEQGTRICVSGPEGIGVDNECIGGKGAEWEFPKKCLSTAEAHEAPGIYVKTEDALGLVSKETLYVYPPGSPFLVAGEVISWDVLRKMVEYEAAGFKVRGQSREGYILTVKCEK